MGPTELMSRAQPEMRGTIVGLGLHPLARSDLLVVGLLSFLGQFLRANESFVLLGDSPSAGQIAAWIEKSPIGPRMLGYFPQLHATYESPGTFNRAFTLERFFRRGRELRYFVLLGPSSDYLEAMRYLMPKTAFSATLVLPFLAKGLFAANRFDPPEPIVGLFLPCTGTSRCLPVLRTLLEGLGRPTQRCRPPDFHRRWMMQRQRGVASQNADGPLLPPLESIRASQLDSDYLPPSQTACDDYYSRAVAGLDLYQAMYVQMHAFSPLQVFSRFEDIRMIALMRDPRDLLISFYFYHIQPAYFLYTERADEAEAGFPHRHKEDLLISLMERGWRYLSFNQWIEFPCLADLVAYFVQCLEHPRVEVIRFEDIHHRPRQTYCELLTRMNLLNLPFFRLTSVELDEALELGSFTYQSNGQARREQQVDPAKPWAGLHRRGTVGDWQNHFTPRVTQRFYQLAGENWALLGY